ncbi:hypothetical protein SDC9_104244 [bioreactor metagenome]|uniref:Uncharacterized protein n=1 Tax=bioreactor metagenome TaxID=1076179 RepID=A0A645AVZ7_9ZZZZ
MIVKLRLTFIARRYTLNNVANTLFYGISYFHILASDRSRKFNSLGNNVFGSTTMYLTNRNNKVIKSIDLTSNNTLNSHNTI